MKFRYIGKNAKSLEGQEMPAVSYGGASVLNGETIELDGFFAEKAMINPNYELIKTRKKSKKAPEPIEEEIEVTE